jgi:hypothetical protein
MLLQKIRTYDCCYEILLLKRAWQPKLHKVLLLVTKKATPKNKGGLLVVYEI